MELGRAVLAVIILGLVVAPAAASATPPPPPAAYYGTLTVNGQPAPAGLTIVATIGGEVRGRVVTDSVGRYGGAGAFDAKLQVNATDAETGATVHFYVEGVEAPETSTWHSGDVTQVNLSATGVALGSGGGTGGGPVSSPTPAEHTTVNVSKPGDGQVNVSVHHALAGHSVSINVSAGSGASVVFDGLTVTPTVGGDFTLNASVTPTPPNGTPPVDVNGNGRVDAADQAIAYLTIAHTLPDTEISGVRFRFRVASTRLNSLGIQPGAVRLWRYHDGSWTALSTTVVGTQGGYVEFETMSPGLSVYAVAPKPSAEGTVAGSSGEAGTQTASGSSERTPVSGPTATSASSGSGGHAELTTSSSSEAASGSGPIGMVTLVSAGVLVLLAVLVGGYRWRR